MDEIFHDKSEECLKFDIYADPDQCDDQTALDTVVDCNSNPASTIAAAEILLRRLLHEIADMRTVVLKVILSQFINTLSITLTYFFRLLSILSSNYRVK